MAAGTILVGTVGQGVMRSPDDGEHWQRASLAAGLHSDAIVRCLTVHPGRPATVFAGTDLGLYRSDDGGAAWQHLRTPMDKQAVWAIAADPADPDTLLAGTGTPSLPRLFRSADGGATWQPSAVEIADECDAVGVPRPTAIAFDPATPGSVWMGIEVEGLRHSSDGGATWSKTGAAIRNLDVHNVVVTAGPPRTIIVLVNNDIWTSTDDGATWANAGAALPLRYPRGAAVRPDDPRMVFATLGDSTPGSTGAVLRSRDAGQSWESLPLPTQPNSALWVVHMARQQPDTVLTGSRYGYLYRSDDGGDSWRKLWRELSEISSIAYLPAAG